MMQYSLKQQQNWFILSKEHKAIGIMFYGRQKLVGYCKLYWGLTIFLRIILKIILRNFSQEFSILFHFFELSSRDYETEKGEAA